MEGKKIIAAFDFDGTITYRDSFIKFLIFSNGYLNTFLGLVISLPSLLAFVCGKASRQEVKERLLTYFFKGKSLEFLNELGERFAHMSLPGQVRPEALSKIEWHRSKGHRCILISASIENYLIPWAAAQGFDDVLASRVDLDSKGRLTGQLKGINCRGSEKVRRLEELIGTLDQYEIYAYGDSRGDRELLHIADHPFYRTM